MQLTVRVNSVKNDSLSLWIQLTLSDYKFSLLLKEKKKYLYSRSLFMIWWERESVCFFCVFSLLLLLSVIVAIGFKDSYVSSCIRFISMVLLMKWQSWQIKSVLQIFVGRSNNILGRRRTSSKQKKTKNVRTETCLSIQLHFDEWENEKLVNWILKMKKCHWIVWSRAPRDDFFPLSYPAVPFSAMYKANFLICNCKM